jgi:hypothetical protein
MLKSIFCLVFVAVAVAGKAIEVDVDVVVDEKAADDNGLKTINISDLQAALADDKTEVGVFDYRGQCY